MTALQLQVALVAGSAATYTPLQDVKTALLAGYDARVRPSQAAAEASLIVGPRGYVCPNPAAEVVDVSVVFANVENVNQVDLTFEASGQMTMSWHDSRLAFDGTTQAGCYDTVTFDSTETDLLWKPRLVFRDALTAYIGSTGRGVDDLGGDLERIEVEHDGTVLWLLEWRAKLRCDMHFGQLPYDEQAYLDSTMEAREAYRSNKALGRNPDAINLKDRGQGKARKTREDKLSTLGVSASDPSLSHAKKYNKPWEKANELFVDRYGKPFVDDTDEFLQKIMKETEEAPMFDK